MSAAALMLGIKKKTMNASDSPTHNDFNCFPLWAVLILQDITCIRSSSMFRISSSTSIRSVFFSNSFSSFVFYPFSTFLCPSFFLLFINISSFSFLSLSSSFNKNWYTILLSHSSQITTPRQPFTFTKPKNTKTSIKF